MSSITTAVPSGIITNGPDWCIQGLVDPFGNDEPPYTYNECFNSTRGTEKSSFETFCCDGNIIDTSSNIWSPVARNFTTYELDLENLVCCRTGGQLLPGGIQPIDTDYTKCSASEVPTPLASLAATNTDNAALFLATYASASGPDLEDWTVTQTPTCLWVETASGVVSMTEITVPAAEITTLPPPTTDRFGYTIDPSTRSSGDLSETSSQGMQLSGLPTLSGLNATTAPPSPTPSADVPVTSTPSSGYSNQPGWSFMIFFSAWWWPSVLHQYFDEGEATKRIERCEAQDALLPFNA
jgi:hypothetical protein